MKRILTILFFSALLALPCQAQQMLVEKEGHGNEIISLDNLRQITFDGTIVNIEQTDGTVSSTQMEDISRIYFGDFSSIGNINYGTSLVTYITDDEIAVNCPAGTAVTLYSVTGTQVLATRLQADNAHIGIAGIPQGIYIVKANERTAKFVRR